MGDAYRCLDLLNKLQCFVLWDRTYNLVFLPARTRCFEYPGSTGVKNSPHEPQKG